MVKRNTCCTRVCCGPVRISIPVIGTASLIYPCIVIGRPGTHPRATIAGGVCSICRIICRAVIARTDLVVDTARLDCTTCCGSVAYSPCRLADGCWEPPDNLLLPLVAPEDEREGFRREELIGPAVLFHLEDNELGLSILP